MVAGRAGHRRPVRLLRAAEERRARAGLEGRDGEGRRGRRPRLDAEADRRSERRPHEHARRIDPAHHGEVPRRYRHGPLDRHRRLRRARVRGSRWLTGELHRRRRRRAAERHHRLRRGLHERREQRHPRPHRRLDRDEHQDERHARHRDPARERAALGRRLPGCRNGPGDHLRRRRYVADLDRERAQHARHHGRTAGSGSAAAPRPRLVRSASRSTRRIADSCTS
jgi:hypothetical protein